MVSCPLKKNGAGERIRTVDSHLGKVVLYQLSYARVLKNRHNIQVNPPFTNTNVIFW